jgi:hypothetical protein
MGNFLTKSRLVGLGVAMGAAFALQPVAAQTTPSVSDNGRGNAVFVPYYTINEGWRTLVNITNTTENSLAVKVRLHEGRNSRDVLDFNLLLSPADVWVARIVEDGQGNPRLITDDTSCTIPLGVAQNGATASTLAFSDAMDGDSTFRDHDGTNGDMERMSEGYIEVLVMGETDGQGVGPGSATPRPTNGDAPAGDTAWFAKHVNGQPRDCGVIQNDFVRRTEAWEAPSQVNSFALNDIPGDAGSGSPLARLGSTGTGGTYPFQGLSEVGYGPVVSEAALKVNTTLVNQDTGRAAGVDALNIAGYGVGVNLVTAQQFPFFLEPTLATSDGLWDTTAVSLIDGVAESVSNEWSSAPGTGARTDWVVTFPTKRYQTDEDAGNVQAACNVWRNDSTAGGVVAGTIGAGWGGFAASPTDGSTPSQLGGTPECPALGFPNVFQDGNNGEANLNVEFAIFDREEGEATFEVDGPIISPAPPAEVDLSSLPYEVNVLRINNDNGGSVLNSPTGNTDELRVDTSVLDSNADSGWVTLTFLGAGGGTTSYPVTGFVYKQRDFGDPALNFGQANEHAYERAGP